MRRDDVAAVGTSGKKTTRSRPGSADSAWTAADFTRSFRATYGMPPKDYRALALGSSEPAQPCMRFR
ncbi:hypothetical protein [Streptomyces sporangiiformans]|uniref:hypothetical protein n=1 Tax=Streptomyces sporangiiformans TaxID=2315329 RepID=UPI0013C44CC8|nr:hypothetical protein [Streptomyces sporangiiformans]